MEFEGKNKRACGFKVSPDGQVVCDWEATHPKHGFLRGEASPVYIAREMMDGDIISAVKGGRFPRTTVVVRGEYKGKPFYVVFPEEESTAAFLGFLEDNGLSARVEAVQKKLAADRAAAEEKDREAQRRREARAAEVAAQKEEIRKTSIRGFFRSDQMNDYGPVEIRYGIGWFTRTDDGHYYFAKLLEAIPLDRENPELGRGLGAEPLGANEMGNLTVWPCSSEQEKAAVAAEEICRAAREKAEKEEAERVAQEKVAKEAERAEKARRELESAMENELAYFDGTPLANITHRLLHSLGAHERDGVIAVYETSHCAEFGAPTPQDLGAELKALGASWNGREEEWEFPRSEENREKVVAFLREHDVKKDPVALGYFRCWECGVWYRGRRCPCCGEE